MNTRRQFLSSTLAASSIAALALHSARGFSATRDAATTASPPKRRFKLQYAPHFGMFKEHAGADRLAQLQFMADQGFTALEDNGLAGRPVELQEKIGATLARLNMTMGVFILDAGDNWTTSFATGKPEYTERLLAACHTAIDVAKRVNARWLTFIPGYFDRTLPIGIQTGHVIDATRAAADILARANLTMVLEPLSDNPDLFLRTSDQAYAICRAVNSPACKILFDMYHLQRNEGDIIERMNLAWNEIAYFQIGDNPKRNEPGTGEMNYKNIFRHIHTQGYRGVMGMEHGNAGPGKTGELALIKAYEEADSF